MSSAGSHELLRNKLCRHKADPDCFRILYLYHDLYDQGIKRSRHKDAFYFAMRYLLNDSAAGDIFAGDMPPPAPVLPLLLGDR